MDGRLARLCAEIKHGSSTESIAQLVERLGNDSLIWLQKDYHKLWLYYGDSRVKIAFYSIVNFPPFKIEVTYDELSEEDRAKIIAFIEQTPAPPNVAATAIETVAPSDHSIETHMLYELAKQKLDAAGDSTTYESVFRHLGIIYASNDGPSEWGYPCDYQLPPTQGAFEKAVRRGKDTSNVDDDCLKGIAAKFVK